MLGGARSPPGKLLARRSLVLRECIAETAPERSSPQSYSITYKSPCPAPMQQILRLPAYRHVPTARVRLAAIALSLAICLGIGVMLVWMGMIGGTDGARRDRITAVSFSPDPARKTGGAAEAQAPAAPSRIVPQEAVPPPQVPVPVPSPPVMPPLDLSRKTADPVSSFDLGKLARRSGAAGGGAQGSGAVYGPGEGPGGQTLYNAEWYREPSDAEISGYMPASNVRPEWAMIACRTVERYHVENCQELGESPRGSGLARAMRRAAWQFLVRPPRIDGKPVIGAWVRIRFDFKSRAAPEEPATAQD